MIKLALSVRDGEGFFFPISPDTKQRTASIEIQWPKVVDNFGDGGLAHHDSPRCFPNAAVLHLIFRILKLLRRSVVRKTKLIAKVHFA